MIVNTLISSPSYYLPLLFLFIIIGKLGSIRMGDLTRRDASGTNKTAQLVTERIEQMKLKRERLNEQGNNDININKKQKNTLFFQSKGSLTTQDDMYSNTALATYRPKTRDTRIVYEEILSLIQVSLGDQPQDILHSAVEEIIGMLYCVLYTISVL